MLSTILGILHFHLNRRSYRLGEAQNPLFFIPVIPDIDRESHRFKSPPPTVSATPPPPLGYRVGGHGGTAESLKLELPATISTSGINLFSCLLHAPHREDKHRISSCAY
jgi:hypothetical protein